MDVIVDIIMIVPAMKRGSEEGQEDRLPLRLRVWKIPRKG